MMSNMMRKNFVINLALATCSLAVCVLAIEIALRLLFPFSTFGAGQELAWFREGPRDGAQLIVPDADLGFRPVLDNGVYDGNGILPNASVLSSATRPRVVLFVGDSVTARGRLIRAISSSVGAENVSYLNGGVEAYNIQQEVEFFFRYQVAIKPSRIIQIIHVNDLQSTPIAYRGPDGRLNVYALNTMRKDLNVWLFRNSYLYRLAVAAAFPHVGAEDLANQAREALRRMRDYARKEGIAYNVLVFPILSPYERWSPYERNAHGVLLDICRQLRLDPVDLLPISEMMISAGADPMEKSGDNWHPNDRFAELAAAYILEKLPELRGISEAKSR
jgi:hypothetical protein